MNSRQESFKMRSKVFFVFFIVVIDVLYASSSPYLDQLMMKRTRYCGSHLTTTLSLVCRGHYPSVIKKSYGDMLAYEEYDDDNDLSDSGAGFPFLSKEFAKSFVPQKVRKEVADECCHKPCTIDEMRYYCGK